MRGDSTRDEKAGRNGDRWEVHLALVPFAATILLTLVVAGAALLALRASQSVTGELLGQYARALGAARELDSLAVGKAAADRAYLLTGELRFVDDVLEQRASFDAKLVELREASRTERGRALSSHIGDAEHVYREAVDTLIAMRADEQETSAEALRWFSTEVYPRFLDLEAALIAYVAHKEDLLEQETARTETAARRAAGTVLVVVVTAIGLTAVVGWAFGVDAARRLRAMRHTAQRAEKRARLRDEVISMASHDLRTPLSTLVLHLDALHLDLRRRKLDDPGVQKRLQAARRQIDSQVVLLDRLLDVSRIEAGRLDLRLEEGVDLADVARHVAEKLEPQAEKAGSQVQLSAPPEPVAGRWDRTRVEQVLTNLLSNAIKYSSRKPVQLEVFAGAQAAHVLVRDSGAGIAPEQSEVLFERFETAAKAGGPAGAGLGLWISARIVEALGGRIGVTSNPDQGTEFRVDLPYEART